MSSESKAPVRPEEQNFCAACGLSIRPLKVPHVARRCSQCAKTVHIVEQGVKGGITVREGDSFVLPPGTVEISLIPKPGTFLYRPGLSMLLRMMILHHQPNKPEDIGALLDEYENISMGELRAHPELKDLDLDSAEDSKAVLDRVSKDKDARIFWAYTMGMFAVLTREAISENDAQKSPFAAYHAAATHALFRLKDEVVEDTLYRGYLANRVVYEAAAAASTTPAQAEAVKKLEPLFSKLEESVLHTWVEDGLPIGPRIGVTGVPEPTLRALAWRVAPARIFSHTQPWHRSVPSSHARRSHRRRPHRRDTRRHASRGA